MMRGRLFNTLRVAAVAASLALPAVAAQAAEEATPLPKMSWSFDGIFGRYDDASLQRGFLVYAEVCSTCHSMNLMSYRDLTGIGLSEDTIKGFLAERNITVPDLDDTGQPTERPAKPSDHFKAPFPNELAARAANGGALPPDLSLMAKARFGGPDYIHAILTGFSDPPPGFHLQEGMYYNKYFPGHQIAMPPPLQPGDAFPDGTPGSVEQKARDVANFLMFAAEPKLEERKRVGIKVMVFLLLMTGLLYAVKRKIWAAVH